MLLVESIQKSINGHIIVDSITLTAKPGEVTVIIGPNGSGKSTLVRAISLVDKPDKGTITIGDDRFVFPEPENGNPAPPWPRLTTLFQALHLWPHLTIRENVLLPARKRTAERPELFDELKDEFDLEHVMHRYPNEVSGGERQRAAIVRALALEPCYLVLDEPTAASDVEHIPERCVIVQGDVLGEKGAPPLLRLHLPAEERTHGYRAILSSLTVHHFEHAEKAAFYQRAFELLEPGGILINADLFSFASEHLTQAALDLDLQWMKSQFTSPKPEFREALKLPPDERSRLCRLWINHYRQDNRLEPIEDGNPALGQAKGQAKMLVEAGFSDVASVYRHTLSGILWARKKT